MDKISSLLYSFLEATLAVSPVNVSVTGTYQYNPSMSQVEACQRAEDKAKTTALQKVFGQDFGADSTMSCREGKTHTCDSITNVYENTRGYIQSISDRREKVENWTCTVSLTAGVMQLKPKQTTLQAQVQLDRVTYTTNDKINIQVDTNTKGMVTIYQYDPMIDKMTKVWPTSTYRGDLWTYDSQALQVVLPANKIEPRNTPYYYFVTVTAGPIPTMSNYRLHEFYKMWDNLPYESAIFVRKSFYVSRSNL